MKNTLYLALALSLGLSFTTTASAVTAGGVTWDENSIFDFSSQGGIFETDVGAVGDVLEVWGAVQFLNGAAGFCTGCSELTFSGEYIVKDVGDFDGNSTVDIVFDMGFVNFYSDQDAADFDATDRSSAEDGLLWLALDAQDTTHVYDPLGVPTPKIGDLFASLDAGLVFGELGDAGSGFGVFDVVGGAAAAFLDTDTITEIGGQALTNGPADLTFTSSFQPLLLDGEPTGLLIATGELLGETQVPEPATIALLGLGLLGLGATRRRKV